MESFISPSKDFEFLTKVDELFSLSATPPRLRSKPARNIIKVREIVTNSKGNFLIYFHGDVSNNLGNFGNTRFTIASKLNHLILHAEFVNLTSYINKGRAKLK